MHITSLNDTPVSQSAMHTPKDDAASLVHTFNASGVTPSHGTHALSPLLQFSSVSPEMHATAPDLHGKHAPLNAYAVAKGHTHSQPVLAPTTVLPVDQMALGGKLVGSHDCQLCPYPSTHRSM